MFLSKIKGTCIFFIFYNLQHSAKKLKNYVEFYYGKSGQNSFRIRLSCIPLNSSDKQTIKLLFYQPLLLQIIFNCIDNLIKS